jgi:hypothetical protein
MQQALKSPAGMARAWIVASELFEQLLAAVHDAVAALYSRFGREALSAFTGGFETRIGLADCAS